MTYEELVLTPEHYTAEVQIELYNRVETYLKENKLTHKIKR